MGPFLAVTAAGPCSERVLVAVSRQQSKKNQQGERHDNDESFLPCDRSGHAVAEPAANAQDFPSRPITIIVGVAPGGVTDVTTRQYADAVTRAAGWKFVIENRPVAGGAVAAAAVQNAAPDGYTLLCVVGSQFSSLPSMGHATYDPVKGFTGVTVLFRLDSRGRAIREPGKVDDRLAGLGKSKAGGISMGSPGASSPGHLMAAKIARGTKRRRNSCIIGAERR